MKNRNRLAILTVASLFFIGLGLSQLAPRVFMASPTEHKTTADQPDSSAPAPAAPATVAASSLRGTLSLFSWGPGFYGFCYNGTESNPQSDPPWVACPDDWTETISTYNLHAGLERLVRIPRQNGTFSHSKPRLSPDGTKIVYAEMGEDGYNLEIYVMNSDGTNPVNLSDNPSYSPEADPQAVFRCRYPPPHGVQISNAFRCMDTEPAWSPDGQHIVFVSGRTNRRELYVMKADGSDLTLLETRANSAPEGDGASDPVWSPDGTKIAYSLNRREITILTLNRIVEPDGDVIFSVADDKPLTIASTGIGGITENPAWSPDGTKLAFVRQSIDFNRNTLVWEIYTISADGTGETRVTDTADELEHHPVWSPDGTKLAYPAFKPEGDNFYRNGRLYVLDLNTKSRTRIETRGPNTDVFSWVDPCAAPPTSTAAKSARTQAKSAALKPGQSNAAASTYKCIQEIVVNVTTDEPDTDTTDEFCDTDEDEIGNQCSLRAAIQEANARPGLDLITFDIPGSGLHTIAPTSELPDINEQVAIDATTQPGYTANAPVVELSGVVAGAANGFNVRAGGVRIAGLIINRFTGEGDEKGNGIYALDTLGLRVQSCFIGTDAAGMTAAPNDVGVYLRNTTDSTVGGLVESNGNLISGNDFGVSILGSESVPQGDNNVFGNRIGLDRAGANGLGNKTAGVVVIASTHNDIGSETDTPGVAPGNVVSGNNPDGGVGISLSGAKKNTVAGNLIGTDATGKKGFGNGIGVYLSNGSANNTIGGYSALARNVISGNKFGLDLFGAAVNDNLVLGNYVGTDITGQAIVPITGVPDFPQQRRGITIEGGRRNQIGNGSDTRNVVAGNAEVQIGVLRPEAADNLITGNYIGLFADGNTSPTYDPREIGVWILGATKTIVGDGEANIISGNGLGVLIANPTNSLSAQNKLLYNYIGTNAAGTAARANTSGGVIIAKSSNNVVEGNVISGNGGTGGLAIANNEAEQSSTAAPGSQSLTAAYPASASNVSTSSALSHVVALLRERTASSVRQDKGGIVTRAEETAETKNNVVIENYIGTDANGQAAIPNANAGVFIGPGANENMIGAPGDGNVISGNSGGGILIGNSQQSTLSPTGNKIQDNIIGLNANATTKIPNTGSGVSILFGAGTIIGGDTAQAGNIIAGNGGVGVAIVGTSNTVRFNFIGTNREGANNLGNASDGLKLENVAGLENTIADNAIGGNGGVGINIAGVAQAGSAPFIGKPMGVRPRDLGLSKLTKILGNSIGVVKVANGQNVVKVKVGNILGGLKIFDAFGVVVTNLGSNVPNIIAANSGPGILIEGQNSTGNVVEGAIIGTDEQGASGLGNAGDGVRIVNAPANIIGGENKPGAARLGNVIAGNTGNGIAVEGGNAGGNALQGNLVGVFGTEKLVIKTNGKFGIRIDGVPNTVVGLPPGLAAATKELFGNVVAGNPLGGLLLQSASGTRVSGNAIGTDHDNSTDLGNDGPGILLTNGTSGTVVGGPEEGSGNTIAGNEGSGVRIDQTGGEGNLVDPNSIYNNRGYGIDLGRRGHTPNDFGDADTGPNRLQNYPEITAREVTQDGQLVVSYRLTSAPGNSNYGTAGIYVEFFKADPSGEGQKFLGFTHYTEADFNNGAPIVKQVNLGSVATLGITPDDPITATASDASGNTSEFSPPFSSRVLVVTKTDDTNDDTCDADCSLREALAYANAGDEITFASPLFDSAQTIKLNGSEIVVNKSVTVRGKGAHLLTVSGDNSSRIFQITDGATPTLGGMTISQGNAGGAFIGGGILNAGTLTLVDSQVKDNIADRGAGIYNTETLIVRASTVSGNIANGSATPAGAGIQTTNGGVLEVVNSTVSGNSATVSDGAGGIYIADGAANITGSTITNNSAPQGASNAGGIKNKDGVVMIGNSIIASNIAASADLVGAFTSAGYNLIGVGDAAAMPSFPPGNPNAKNDIVGTSGAPVDARLDALGDYGGKTPTHRLQIDSPAIDKGLAFGETKDQRGLTRPSDDSATPNALGGDGSDIGSYEAQFVAAATASLKGHITFGGKSFGGVTVTLTHPDSTTSTTVTGADGLYSFANLSDGNYTVTPMRARFTFTPASRAAMMSGADITGLDFEAASTATNPQTANGSVIISEFRFTGATLDDEYIELYNNTDAAIDISGYMLETTAGQLLTIPADTMLPARAHYLFAHQTGYSLTDYGRADQPYTGFDLSGDTGLMLLDASGVIVDAVGLGSSPSPYREGTTSAPVEEAGQYAFVRKLVGGVPQDTGDNVADFQLVSTDGGTYGGQQSILGAPGPEGLTSPIQRNAFIKPSLVEPMSAATAPPNRVRSSFGVNPMNAAYGTLSIQRRFKNTTAQPVTRLRFRITDLTTMGSAVSPGTQADLRVLSSSGTVWNSQNQVVTTVNGLTLETPPVQALGGGINSTLTLIPPGGALAGGSSIDVQFLLGVQTEGNFRFFVNVEALTAPAMNPPATTKAGALGNSPGRRNGQ